MVYDIFVACDTSQVAESRDSGMEHLEQLVEHFSVVVQVVKTWDFHS